MYLDISGMKLSSCNVTSCMLFGEVGGCTRRVQTARPSMGSALETPWLALGGFCPPVKKWAEKMILSTLWTPIPGSEAFFNSLDEWLLAKSHDYCKLVNGLSHKRVENGCKDSCRKFDG